MAVQSLGCSTQSGLQIVFALQLALDRVRRALAVRQNGRARGGNDLNAPIVIQCRIGDFIDRDAGNARAAIEFL